MLLLAAVPAYACRAAFVGGVIVAAQSHSAAQKQQFMAQLQQTDTER